jgi:tubulin beta
MIDVLFKGGLPHMKVFQEAIIAQHNPFSAIKRYESVELDKWMAGYDVSWN